jgi:hypothetical protein
MSCWKKGKLTKCPSTDVSLQRDCLNWIGRQLQTPATQTLSVCQLLFILLSFSNQPIRLTRKIGGSLRHL